MGYPTPFPHRTILKRGGEGVERAADIITTHPYVVARVDQYGVRHEDFEETPIKAINNLFGWHAWPGGYPVAFLDFTNGDELCPRCAKAEYLRDKDFRAQLAAGRITSDYFPGGVEDHGEIQCANCSRFIVGPEGDEDDRA